MRGLIIDNFAGGGGASTGIEAAQGVRTIWPLVADDAFCGEHCEAA